MTSLPEADALTAGPPLAHAHGSPTARSWWVLTALTPRVRSSRCTAASPSANSQPRTAAPSSGTTTYLSTGELKLELISGTPVQMHKALGSVTSTT
ncbi:hypothetical protein STEG23_005380 [Scotinomys teguina]